MKRCLAIINPISGTQSKEAIPTLLAEAVAETDYQLFVTYTKYANHAFELASMAVQEHYDLVIAVGGDGTVNEVAKALIYSDTALAIIPKGSGNGLARALDIPMAVKKAVEVLRTGKLETIDCCQANGTPFFCTCGMGFDAEVSKAFAEAPFRGLLSYAKTAIEQYINYKPNYYDVEIEGTEKLEQIEAFVIAAANANQYGNNAYIAPKASLTDGLMDLVVLKPFKKMELPQITMQLFNKGLSDNSHSSTYQCTKAKIKRATEGVVHLDGEPVQMPKEINIELKAKAIKVLVP